MTDSVVLGESTLANPQRVTLSNIQQIGQGQRGIDELFGNVQRCEILLNRLVQDSASDILGAGAQFVHSAHPAQSPTAPAGAGHS